MKAIERLIQYIDFKGFNKRTFELSNELSNGYLGKQLARNADLGEGILVKILENCPDLLPEWLLTGKGEMLKSELVKSDTEDGIDYKELYFDAKYTIDIQKKYIYSLETKLNGHKNAS